MSLAAAASGFVVFLLSVPVVQGQSGWGVAYNSTQMCAFKGSPVDMSCTYRYPSRVNDHVTTVEKTFWFTKKKGDEFVDLTTDSEYSGRVQYSSSNNICTLRITDLRESDSAKYKFRFITNQPGGRYTGEPGVTLSVTALQMQVTRRTGNQSHTEAELQCHSSCSPDGRHAYVWLKNGQNVPEETSSYGGQFYPGDNISCALKGHEDFRSPSLYALKVPSVSVSPVREIVENSSVTLNCSGEAKIAANYTWYKKNLNPTHAPLNKEPQLVFRSIQSSDSGQYFCAAENELGRRTSEYVSIDVKYPPRPPSVSVSPSAEIVEGSSVTLTCSSDANPAAKYTWYKENQTLLQGQEGVFKFPSIRSQDRGIYRCTSENKYRQMHSSPQFIDVQYAPRVPSVSVSPSAEIVEGSSVTLTCSSDANPAATYTWYKENEDSPKASGQIFTITDFRPEHSGNYYCEAQNSRGCHSLTLYLAVKPGEWELLITAGTITALLIVAILISALLWIRKKRAPKQPSKPLERPDKSAQKQPAEPEDNLHYASVHFSKKQADPLYSNIRPAEPQSHKREEEANNGVVYTVVKFNSGCTAPT